MTTRRFVFDRYLYRVCNHETWQRLEQMDGMAVEVFGPPEHHAIYETWNNPRHELGNYVSATFPDGHRISLFVFNSELQPLDLNTGEQKGDTACAESSDST